MLPQSGATSVEMGEIWQTVVFASRSTLKRKNPMKHGAFWVFIKWSRRESNPRPLHCERSALPTELRPLDDTVFQKITSLDARCPVLTESGSRHDGIFDVRAARYRGASPIKPLAIRTRTQRSGTRTRTRRNGREYEYEYHFIEYEYEGGGVIKIDDRQSPGCRGPCRNVGGPVSS